jgi:hypothetical protein
MENLKDLVQFGNKKLPKTTAIFNIGSATDCPSKALGLCALCKECYAMKAERQYPQVLPYRERQLAYWSEVSATDFAFEFLAMISKKRNKVDALRVNEAGDFYSQADVHKLEEIAQILATEGIKTYVYTARRDLDFSMCPKLNVMGSFITAEQKHSAFIGVKGAKEHARKMRGFYRKTAVCPGDCKKCRLCQVAKGVVIFCEIH